MSNGKPHLKETKVSIIGSGLIGKSFAMIFASVGYQVYMYDAQQDQVSLAIADIKKQLKALEASGTLKGSLTADQQFSCIHEAKSLQECLANSKHAQECIPENLPLKIKVFKEMDAVAGPNTILCSSTSCILPSKFTKDLTNKANCIVAHPLNPPYYVPAIEVVPAPWTSKDTMLKTCTLLDEVGLIPIKFSREIPGFAVNRIQYALMNECWHLVKDGVLSTDDVDNLMKNGLAMRYVWCGPFETIHLNAHGTRDYIQKYGKTIHDISSSRKGVPSWTLEDGKEIADEMEAKFPLKTIQERMEWRDARLIALSKLKKELGKED